METDVIISCLNDEKKLKKKGVVEMLTLLNSVNDFDDISNKEFEEHLETIKSDNTRFSGIANDVFNRLLDEDLDFYRRYIDNLESKDIEFYTIFCDEYPDRLREIERPPLGIYVKGDISSVSNSIAIVGTRDANNYRLNQAFKIGERLASNGYTVTSGLANGIDTNGHRGALKKGKTVAVLPGDVENIYPGSNRSLASQIEENGALISEVSENVDIHRGRFVERNRIISGLSKAVVIGASTESGGTIHQARFSKQQGRPILLYYREEDNQSPDKLIRTMNAKPFRTLQDLEVRINDIEDKDQNNSKGDNTLDSYLK